MKKDILNMDNLRKVIKKRNSYNGGGFVNYIYKFQYSVTKAEIDELYEDICIHFPNITEKHIEVRIESESILKLVFFTFNLPPKNTDGFEEEDSFDFDDSTQQVVSTNPLDE